MFQVIVSLVSDLRHPIEMKHAHETSKSSPVLNEVYAESFLSFHVHKHTKLRWSHF